jgi:hypothetical protein
MINWVEIFTNFLLFKLFRVIVINLSMKHYLKIMHTEYCVTRVLSRMFNDSLVGRSRTRSFQSLLDRIWKRLNGWKERFLSQAGKEVLLKAVIQAIPTYTMSIFQLPKVLCKKINSMMARFWWGHKENLSRTAWLSWDKLSLSKEEGGLGYRDLEAFNTALLAKQGWRLLQHPQSLVAKVYKEKYFSEVTFLDSELGSKPSFAWCSIWNSRKLLKEGLIWRVGDGESIQIWGDCWVPYPHTYSIQSPVRGLPHDSRVSSLIDP